MARLPPRVIVVAVSDERTALSAAVVAELQERAARATPGAVEEHSDGCWLRHTDSSTTWWAGAALLHGEAPDLGSRITLAERFYEVHGAAPRFQVFPACPTDLDEALSRRGYARSGAMSLEVADADEVARRLPASPLQVELTTSPEPAWCRLLMAAQEPGADPGPEWRLLQRVERPSAYATAHRDGRAVAVARAVVDTGWTGVFGMGTLPEERRQGAGSALLAALARWGGGRGCRRMYLQATDGVDARSLYRRAGFRQACTYHYRLGAHP